MYNISRSLIHWYLNNKRDLPWRNTKDPYLIWVSEIILQQTQVQTGLLYYERIISRFANIKQMANASEDEVMKLWQGLGYYSRARNMHHTAIFITANNDGVFPTNYEAIVKLKGVGPYTAAAIASFAFDLPHAVVDGNVYRFLSRCFGIAEPIDSHEGKKIFNDLAHQLLDKKHPAIHNQAIMELGSLICKPSSPLCKQCPVEVSCIAKKQNTIELYPVKAKKTIQKNRYLTYLYIHDEENMLINKRDEKDIWRGLYELPLFEMSKSLTKTKLLENIRQYLEPGQLQCTISIQSQAKHQLTHQVLHLNFVDVKVDRIATLSKDKLNNFKQISISKIHHYAFPKPIERFIDDFLNSSPESNI